jgi:hypothetical protein
MRQRAITRADGYLPRDLGPARHRPAVVAAGRRAARVERLESAGRRRRAAGRLSLPETRRPRVERRSPHNDHE